MNIFESLLIDEKCVAIGEVGLDFYRNASNKEVQKSVFKNFLRKSLYFNKPVVIHSREATPEILIVLDDFVKHNSLKGVFHCFSGDNDLLNWGIEHGFYFSFTGNITFPKSYKLRSVLKFIPENRILLETDCPYLTPMPFRGKRNEPAFVIYTLYTAYKMKTMSLQGFVTLLEENVRDFFNI
jgi:TatD DNase family protein